MTTIRLRRGTAAEWTSVNPILSDGEQGLESDTKKRKLGDGVTAWNALGYDTGGSAPAVDSVTLTELTDPLSPERSLLNGLYRPAVSRVADLPRPIILPHRGAGAWNAPENTLGAFKIGAALGYPLIDGGDWWTTADDTLVSSHDSSLAFATDRNVTVSTLSAMAVPQVNVDASVWFGGGFKDTNLMTDADFLNTFAGLVAFSPEPKSLRAAQLLSARIQKLGIQQSVFPTSFFTSFLQPFLDVGCTDVLYNITSWPSDAARAGYLASGIKWLGIPFDGVITVAQVQQAITEGFEIMVGTMARKSQMGVWDAIKTQISAWVSDDPVYFEHALDPAKATRYRRTTDPYATGTFYHGHLPNIAKAVSTSATDGGSGLPAPYFRGSFLGSDRWGLQMAGTNTWNAWSLQGWGCPLLSPAAYICDYYVTFDALGNLNTRWSGQWWSQPTDASYHDQAAATETGYQSWQSVSGNINMSGKVAGAASSTQTLATGSISAPLVLTAALAAGVAITALPVAATLTILTADSRLMLPTGDVAVVATDAPVGSTSIAIASLTPVAAVASGVSIPQAIRMRWRVTSTQNISGRIDGSPVLSAALSAGVTITSLTVNPIPVALTSGTKLLFPGGVVATLSAAAAVGATTLAINSVTPAAAAPIGSQLPRCVSMTDTNARGEYFFFGRNDNKGTTGLKVSYSKVSIT